MAFSVGGGRKGAPQAEINVTPLIDIVLVLLIIFMVMTPVMLKEIVAKVPQKQTENVPRPPGDNPIVVEVDAQDHVTLNGDPVAPGCLRRADRRSPGPRPPKGRVLQSVRRRELRTDGAGHGPLQGSRRQDAGDRHQRRPLIGIESRTRIPSTARRCSVNCGGDQPTTAARQRRWSCVRMGPYGSRNVSDPPNSQAA